MPFLGWKSLQQARDPVCATVRRDWHRKELGNQNKPICADSAVGNQLCVCAHQTVGPTLSCSCPWYGFCAVEAALLGILYSTTFDLLGDYLNNYGALTAICGSQLRGSIPVSKLLSAVPLKVSHCEPCAAHGIKGVHPMAALGLINAPATICRPHSKDACIPLLSNRLIQQRTSVVFSPSCYSKATQFRRKYAMSSQSTVCRSTAVDTAEAEGETQTSDSNADSVASVLAASMTASVSYS